MIHKPVLTKEVLKYLDPKPGENFIDGTIGQAGHTVLLLEKTGPNGRVLGIDLDAAQIENAKIQTARFGQRIVLVNNSYANIKEVAEKNNFGSVHGILLDLGYSSWQLEDSKKGFSFQINAPLDMRYDLKNPLTAQVIINEYSENDIKEILQTYGEETFAKQIAKKIIEQRAKQRIQTTFQLKEAIEQAMPKKFHYGRIHCATKSFQALRIAVNDELASLTKMLPDALSILVPGGRLVVISFHSLEDRIVKTFFNNAAKEGLVTIATKKPVTGEKEELWLNPRARSAKLRAIVKI